MEPGLTRFESEQPNVKYVHVNIDERESETNKPLFEKYFKGEAIPYTVLVNDKGEAVSNWTGLETYDNLVASIQKLEMSN